MASLQSFESLYYCHRFDICPHCNLYQDQFESCMYANNIYQFRCNHCNELFICNENHSHPLYPEIKKLANSYVVEREMENLKRKYQW